MINYRIVFKHWVDTLPIDEKHFKEHVDMAYRVTSKYENWELKKIPISEIMTYIGTSLENDYFINMKVDSFIDKGLDDVPKIILIPLDHARRKPFLEHKYDDKNIKYEPADGIHRLFMFIKLGLKEVISYVPL